MGNNNDTKAGKQSKLEFYETMRLQGVTLLAKDPIGQGSFSTVCLGYSEQLAERVAVKLIDTRLQSEYVTRFLPRELQLVPTLVHPNIIRVHQIIRSPSYTALVQEYGENGDLLKLMKKRKRIDEVEGRFLFRQLIEAIKYLELKNIVHRDLKCENIFLDRYNNIKLGDFGFARVLRSDQVSDTHCGSRAYVAVELLRGLGYAGNGADIWSAGIVLFVMLTGKMPFDDRKPKEMIAQQMRHNVRFPENWVSSDAQDLIKSMVHPRTELRATTREIVASKWLEGCRYFMRGQVEELLQRSCSTASTGSVQIQPTESQEETNVRASLTSSNAMTD